MPTNKIILTADTELKDNELREWVAKMQTQIITINERTKNIMVWVREFDKKIKKLKEKEK